MAELTLKQRDAAIEQHKERGLISTWQLKQWSYRQTNPRIVWLRRLGAPAFQFKDGKLIEIVGKVNQLLAVAGYDAWWIAYWWINPNDNSGQAPIDLIKKPSALWKTAQQAQK